ncbi:sensor histidine kinase, partial [bacterium]|nr:sensor histidine kinase [bacterium]
SPRKSEPNQRSFRWLLAAQAGWVAFVFFLGLWWVRLVLSQSEKIRELEIASGVSAAEAYEHWQKTKRMLFWESSTYSVLLLGITGLVVWLYWRDLQRSRGIQAFFASVTHELRTPLTSIRLQAETIAEWLNGVEFGEVQGPQKPIRRLLEDTMRLEGQVERTLELARVEGGGTVFSQSFQLKPWLHWLLQSWEETYGDRVDLENKVEDVWIEADPRALQVILRNLFENSLRHGRVFQSADLATSASKEGDAPVRKLRVRLETVRKGGTNGSASHVVLYFRDNGPGYAGETSKLGQIFRKGPQSQGAGVGLYLVRLLMNRMGGEAAFANEDGFSVALRFRESVLPSERAATEQAWGGRSS